MNIRQAVPVGEPVRIPNQQAAEAVEIKQICEKCGKEHKIYAKFADSPKINNDFKAKGFIPFPKDVRLMGDCGY